MLHPRRLRHLGASVLAAAILTLAIVGSGATAARAGTSADITPFKGLGAWVDAFDYAPAFQ